MKTLIGSTALKRHFPDFPRKPKDVDFFDDSFEPEHFSKDEDTYWNRSLALWGFGPIATVDELYTIKVSHAFWNLHGTWNKHMDDVLFLQSKGAKFLPELYDLLYPIWVEAHGAKMANLEASPEEFFNKHVKRIYDHDSIHASIAYYDEPLFNRILRDNSEVAVSKPKFNALSHEDKLRLVREEVYATALERKLIPQDYTGSPRAAYNYAMMMTVTSFSKGWFPLFIVLNYSELYKPEINFVKRHKENADRLVLL